MRIQPWNLVFLVGFIFYAGIRHVFEQRAGRNEKAISRLDGLERMLIGVMAVGSFLLPALYLFTPWLAFADYHLPGLASRCGTLIMGIALWFFWRAHVDLAQNWSMTLEIRKGHQLIRQGVYSSIRHPMYSAIWLFSVAQGLLLANWLAGWSAFVAFALMYFIRTPREERMMCEFFGQEYHDYMNRTGRLFPRLGISNRDNA